MKKYLLIVIVLMASIEVCQANDRSSNTPNNTVSTNFHPFPPWLWEDIRKRWCGYCMLKNGDEFLVWTFERKDSVIAGTTYSLIEFQGKDTLQFFERQEGKKVYRYDMDTQTEMLMFDYSLEVGDEVEVDGGVRLRVVETDSAFKSIPMYGVRYSKMLKLQGVDDETVEDVWVEGVGSISWGVLPRSMMTEVDKMYVANVSFSLWKGNAAFPIYTEHYKASLLNYRDLTEEEKQKVDGLNFDEREYLDYYFIDDTLCVTGMLDLMLYDFQIECMIDSQNVDIKIYMIDVEDILESASKIRYIENKFPGFKDGVYQVSTTRWIGASPKFPDPKFTNVYKVTYHDGKRVEVVCGESNGVRDVEVQNKHQRKHNGIFDLTGRPVITPTKGIYIQDGRKVLK